MIKLNTARELLARRFLFGRAVIHQTAERQKQNGRQRQEGGEMIRARQGLRKLGHRIRRRVSRMREGHTDGDDARDSSCDRLAQLDLHGAQARQQGRNVKHLHADFTAATSA